MTSKSVLKGKVASKPDGGLFVLPDSHNVVHRKRIIELTAKFHLPTIYYFRYFVSDGGLLSYGPDEMDLFQRTAGYVDRILKGTSPSDLPVQQPTKFELVINLRTAKDMGIETTPGSFAAISVALRMKLKRRERCSGNGLKTIAPASSPNCGRG